MKIICLQENLKDNVSILERICGKNHTLPILQNISLKTEKNFLYLFATDLEIGVTIQVPCKVEKEGESIIPIHLFSQFISQLPNTKITIEEKNGYIFIHTPDFKTKIPSPNKDEFPIIPKVKESNTITINPILLKNTLSQVINSLPVTHTLSEISGVLFHFSNNILKIVSTDSFRLSEKTIYKKSNYTAKKDTLFILPQKTAYELVKIINQTEDIFIHVEQNQILFLLKNTSIISRLLSGEYPNYEQIIPKATKTKLILNKNEFISKVKLASIFSSKINEVRFIIHPQKNTLEINSSDQQKGNFSSHINTPVEGDECSIVFNYRYILDGLANISEEEVIFELNNASSPAIIKSKEDNYLYVVMPIKT